MHTSNPLYCFSKIDTPIFPYNLFLTNSMYHLHLICHNHFMVLLPVILCCIQLKVWMQSYFHYHLKIAEYMPAAIHLLLSTINIPRGDCCRVGLLLQKNMQVPFYQNIWVILHSSCGFLNSWIILVFTMWSYFINIIHPWTDNIKLEIHGSLIWAVGL